MTVPLLQLPRTLTVDANGTPRSNAKLYVFAAQTTNPVVVWQDPALTIPHAVPIRSNAEGTFPPIYPDPALGDLKINITDEGDVQIPGYPIDNIPAQFDFSQNAIGQLLHPRTAAERAASVTPVNFAYAPGNGNVLRYGSNTTPGTTDMTAFVQAALNVANQGGGSVFVPAGLYLVGNINWPGNNITLTGAACGFSVDSLGTPQTIFKAKAGTTIVFDLVQTGAADDCQGNYLADFQIDGNGIAQLGIDNSIGNTIERVSVKGCTVAGIHLSNFTNAARIRRCKLNNNSGWGLQCEGGSSTTFFVEGCEVSVNTLGGIDLEAGVNVRIVDTIIESNVGPGLLINKPNTNFGGFINFLLENCWFESNASGTPFFSIVISSGTTDLAHSPARIHFNKCRINPSVAVNKHISISAGAWVTFEECNFDASTASDAITFTSNAFLVAFIESATSTLFTGLSPTQLDNAIAQGNRCYSSDRDVKRAVGAGAPAAAFQNSWVNSAGGFTPARYWFDREGNVCIEGSVKSGTLNTAIFTLPVGYRPQTQMAFAVDANGTHGLIYVNTNGTVVPNVGSATQTNLDGIRFSTG